MARLISSSRALYILEGIDALAERIRHASEELRTLRDVAAIAAPAFDRPRVSGSRNSDAMANRMASIERYESELARNIDRWIEKQKEADRLIASLDDPKQMQALHMRYVEGCGVPLIADTMHYSKKQVYEIIHKGLDAIDSVLEARAQAEQSASRKGALHDSGESATWPFPDSFGVESGNETQRKAGRNANETEVCTS